MGPKYKFGVEVPRSVKHALLLDKMNGNHLWEEVCQKVSVKAAVGQFVLEIVSPNLN